MNPVFFATPSQFRAWLEANHDQTQELWVGYYKKGTGKPSLTWPESVDEALCYGWIDGLRKGIDDISYMIRFTPRKKSSIWSAVNLERVKELSSLGLMRPEGLRAFEARKQDKSVIYSYEQKVDAELGDAYEQQFRANKQAWDFFQSQAPSYRKTAIWKIISAKKEETKLRRLVELIQYSEQGQAIPSLTWQKKKE
ncbi:YdeI/OmpD-associated family protein [Paenibacillus radicis (ex Xue et al. 2023)]|uniref:YdeI/OmpD-associated family protein n=1 Tax=Paenibacillus radicis (ex Xue et al. 2023) TaxID=2972489 RepID=A0ABT1YDM9_9BACL|nr:YdeI/OmpD-associated family protein [Paenibacillus radicis (ex Xue et al. 2023)]MCR8631306.1 YdeI/OmpD-associated family protein [Paenibacillus radicis (ex Xue et al. 2023)]